MRNFIFMFLFFLGCTESSPDHKQKKCIRERDPLLDEIIGKTESELKEMLGDPYEKKTFYMDVSKLEEEFADYDTIRKRIIRKFSNEYSANTEVQEFKWVDDCKHKLFIYIINDCDTCKAIDFTLYKRSDE